MIAEAVGMAFDRLYEPRFHPNSHGFRRGRSCHTAIAEAIRCPYEGYESMLDLDLERFSTESTISA